MKKIIYKGTIEENDYNRVKDIDSENYITPDGKTVLPKLAQMPLRDLAILSFTSENELKKYYTGNEEYFSYSVVELMLDTGIKSAVLRMHCICFITIQRRYHKRTIPNICPFLLQPTY